MDPLELEVVGNLGCDVLEPDGCAGDALEAHPVQGQAWQLADLDLPLHQRVRVGVAVNTQQEELLPLLVITVVFV